MQNIRVILGRPINIKDLESVKDLYAKARKSLDQAVRESRN